MLDVSRHLNRTARSFYQGPVKFPEYLVESAVRDNTPKNSSVCFIHHDMPAGATLRLE